MTTTTIKLAFTLTAALFATTTAIADDVYQGLASGNSDLFDGHRADATTVAVQPGVGDHFDVYRGLGIGNGDIFNSLSVDAPSGTRPDIYQGFSGNPDLRY